MIKNREDNDKESNNNGGNAFHGQPDNLPKY